MKPHFSNTEIHREWKYIIFRLLENNNHGVIDGIDMEEDEFCCFRWIRMKGLQYVTLESRREDV